MTSVTLVLHAFFQTLKIVAELVSLVSLEHFSSKIMQLKKVLFAQWVNIKI